MKLRLALFVLSALVSVDPSTAQGPPFVSDNPAKAECGSVENEWCGGAPDDPCSKHKSTEACRADARCEGLPFVRDSIEECNFDDRCFSERCATVGCMLSCEKMTPDECARYSTRCELKAGRCAKSIPCPQKFNVPSGRRS